MMKTKISISKDDSCCLAIFKKLAEIGFMSLDLTTNGFKPAIFTPNSINPYLLYTKIIQTKMFHSLVSFLQFIKQLER